jgi:hypothetical protein
MAKILNTWRSSKDKRTHYDLGEPIYKNGDWAIYRQFTDAYIYAYKDIAVGCLRGINKEHIDALAANVRPDGHEGFMFDRSLYNLSVGQNLPNNPLLP